MRRKNPNFYLRSSKNKKSGCDHGPDMWCNKCVNTGTYHDLRDQGLGHGFVMGIDLASGPDQSVIITE
jgi:hypothetical protein